MHWLALRLLRPYLIVAAGLSAVSTTFVILGAGVIRQRADAVGIAVENYAPDRTGVCETGVNCLPAGVATNVAQAIALVAAFVPLLIGLILGVPLFALDEDETATFAALALAVCTVGTVLLGRRTVSRTADRS